MNSSLDTRTVLHGREEFTRVAFAVLDSRGRFLGKETARQERAVSRGDLAGGAERKFADRQVIDVVLQ